MNYKTEELEINILKAKVENLTDRLDYLEKCYIDWFNKNRPKKAIWNARE